MTDAEKMMMSDAIATAIESANDAVMFRKAFLITLMIADISFIGFVGFLVAWLIK